MKLRHRIWHWWQVHINGYHCFGCKHRKYENSIWVDCARGKKCRWYLFEKKKPDLWEPKEKKNA